MSDLKEILADVKQEGDTDPFAAMESETPSESPTENEPEVEEPEVGESNTPEDNVPFHKHPRWIERERELQELRDQREADARAIAELSERVSERQETTGPVPEWFQELYGDNPIAWEKYSEHDKANREQIKQEAVTELQSRQQKEVDESNHWNNWVNSEIEKLQNSGKEFDRNELIKVMLEYRPTDPDNNFDFEAGHRIYEALQQKPVNTARSDARKQLADMATGRSNTGEPAKKDYMTPSDLRGRSWNAL